MDRPRSYAAAAIQAAMATMTDAPIMMLLALSLALFVCLFFALLVELLNPKR